MQKLRTGDICKFTNKSNFGSRANDGKKCRIVEIVHPDNQSTTIYVIEFLCEEKSLGARKDELTFLCKAIFPKVCPRCRGNIDKYNDNTKYKKINCPFCRYKIIRLDQ